MRKIIAAATMLALTVPALAALPTPAEAGEKRRYHRADDGSRYWRDRNGRYRCQKKNGTTGLLVGGVAGALAGRAIDTRGDRTVGTLLGAAGGAVLGREIDRGGSGSRCR